ncbi:MAG: hypothetical protein IT463_07920 [Planctomycetes bacterium]|nr:hypothetical protein [Planctomycetota bacterium]
MLETTTPVLELAPPGPDVPAGDADLKAQAGIPWVAIALAAHVVLLTVAWFILPAINQTSPIRVLRSSVDLAAVPPVPEVKPQEDEEFIDSKVESVTPSHDEQISPEINDTHNEDPTEQPNRSLAEAENDDLHESPSPHRNASTAVGLGPGAGGGGGGGGHGGFEFRRCGPRGRMIPRKNETRVNEALKWLDDHQNHEGYWSATNFGADSTRRNARHTHNIYFERQGDAGGDTGWERTVDTGLTGLSLLAYAGYGYDHKQGKYRDTCRRAVSYLRRIQSNDGCFGPKDDDHFVYNHAICTMAMAEIYGLSGDRILLPCVERAAQFILQAQNPGLGWRYGVQPKHNDSSVTGWMVLALKSCKMAGINVDYHACYDSAEKWFKAVTVDVKGYPVTGYDQPGSENARLRSAQDFETNPSMDAINIMSMLFMDKADTRDPTLRTQADICAQQPPAWEHHKVDYYYWYYSSLALFQMGGNAWQRWEKPLTTVLLNSQRGYAKEDAGSSAETLDEHGSWDPVDAWGQAGGRVYATAINCLTMQVWERYEKLEKAGRDGKRKQD